MRGSEIGSLSSYTPYTTYLIIPLSRTPYAPDETKAGNVGGSEVGTP
jgi:hypothetical protein